MSLLLSSCSSGKKSLERGNYYEAVIKSIERLRSNPDNKNAKQTLKDAYPLAIETMTSEIDNLLIGNEHFKYAEIVDRYEKINSMAGEVRRSPAARSLKLKIEEYTSQLAGARSKAAIEAYNTAEGLLAKGDRLSAREAYYLYKNSNNYESNFKDALKKMDLARELATLFVVVEDISVPGLYKINAEFFQNQIIGNLSKNYAKDFIVFMNPAEAKNLNRADQIIMMRFDEFVVGSTRDKEVVKELTSKDSVKTGTATIEGKKVDVYDKVKAKFTNHSKEIISSGVLDVKIIDAATEKLLGNKKFPGKFVWASDWASYNGDKRALNAEQLKLSSRKPLMPPPPQNLFMEFTKPIFNQTRSYLKNFYRKF
jgi:hypothetical protein